MVLKRPHFFSFVSNEPLLTFVGTAPVVAVSDPASVAAVQVGPVNITEDQLVAGLGQLLDGEVTAVLAVGPHLDGQVSRGLAKTG